jgi:NAD-dependent dihydropyrimidine dehydrogenase PreA subunit
MARRLAVVVSQGQSANPAKRKLEEDLVTALLFEPGVEVTVVPHLYDLKPDGTGMLALQGIEGPMVVLAWLYPRAAHWILDRNHVAGVEGQTLLRGLEEDDADEEDRGEEGGSEDAGDEQQENGRQTVTAARARPQRRIYCLDLRAYPAADTFLEEIRRIAREETTKVVELGSWVQGAPSAEQLQRYQQPTNDTAVGLVTAAPPAGMTLQPRRIDEPADRRWYPVIDFSRCTNCMECIDFCLFGVYGIDGQETILVEQPDNCRKGCPACSRVCPENAIIFPQHKSPAIAGSAEGTATLKIDLSKLFGAPEEAEDPLAVAARERDEQLMLAGRAAVGMTVGMPKRQQDAAERPRDELDSLIDQLDDLDL